MRHLIVWIHNASYSTSSHSADWSYGYEYQCYRRPWRLNHLKQVDPTTIEECYERRNKKKVEEASLYHEAHSLPQAFGNSQTQTSWADLVRSLSFREVHVTMSDANQHPRPATFTCEWLAMWRSSGFMGDWYLTNKKILWSHFFLDGDIFPSIPRIDASVQTVTLKCL